MPMTFRDYNPETDEPAKGWFDEMVQHALSQGKKLVVNQCGDIWSLDDKGEVAEYCGRIREKVVQK